MGANQFVFDKQWVLSNSFWEFRNSLRKSFASRHWTNIDGRKIDNIAATLIVTMYSGSFTYVLHVFLNQMKLCKTVLFDENPKLRRRMLNFTTKTLFCCTMAISSTILDAN